MKWWLPWTKRSDGPNMETRRSGFGSERIEYKDGDVIGIIGDAIEVKAEDNQQAVARVLEQMVDEDSELITLFYGADVTEEESHELMTALQGIYADYEIQMHYGGQPHYRYYISVE